MCHTDRQGVLYTCIATSCAWGTCPAAVPDWQAAVCRTPPEIPAGPGGRIMNGAYRGFGPQSVVSGPSSNWPGQVGTARLRPNWGLTPSAAPCPDPEAEAEAHTQAWARFKWPTLGVLLSPDRDLTHTHLRPQEGEGSYSS